MSYKNENHDKKLKDTEFKRMSFVEILNLIHDLQEKDKVNSEERDDLLKSKYAMDTIKLNVDNDKFSDSDFRKFVKTFFE